MQQISLGDRHSAFMYTDGSFEIFGKIRDEQLFLVPINGDKPEITDISSLYSSDDKCGYILNRL